MGERILTQIQINIDGFGICSARAARVSSTCCHPTLSRVGPSASPYEVMGDIISWSAWWHHKLIITYACRVAEISFQILDNQITYNDQGNVRMASFTVRGMLVRCGAGGGGGRRVGGG